MKTIIVGAGLAGLTCAKVLGERGAEVAVFEASDGVGGRVDDPVALELQVIETGGDDPDGRVVERIDPARDVRGLTGVNVGLLWQGAPMMAPCTPLGVIDLLDRAGIELDGREEKDDPARAVVLSQAITVLEKANPKDARPRFVRPCRTQNRGTRRLPF